jgi:hypothetical protein
MPGKEGSDRISFAKMDRKMLAAAIETIARRS